jgi:hypothetical protein
LLLTWNEKSLYLRELSHGLHDNQAYDSIDPADILELAISRRFAGRKIWRMSWAKDIPQCKQCARMVLPSYRTMGHDAEAEHLEAELISLRKWAR